jgi:hypothetical protein
MKVYKGIVKGNTILLEEKADLPDGCPALVEIKPLDQARDEDLSPADRASAQSSSCRQAALQEGRGAL